MAYHTLLQLFNFAGTDDEPAETVVLFFSRASETRATEEYVSSAARLSRETAIRRAAKLNANRPEHVPEILVALIHEDDPAIEILEARNSNGGPLVH